MSECKGQTTNNERQHCAQKKSINNKTTFQNRWKIQVLRMSRQFCDGITERAGWHRHYYKDSIKHVFSLICPVVQSWEVPNIQNINTPVINYWETIFSNEVFILCSRISQVLTPLVGPLVLPIKDANIIRYRYHVGTIWARDGCVWSNIDDELCKTNIQLN
jgi:hypothetical protein